MQIVNQDLQGKIAYLQDENGDVHLPITAVEAIIGPNYNLGTKIHELSHKIDSLSIGLQEVKDEKPNVTGFVTMDAYLELLARVEALESAQSPTTVVSH